MLPLAPLRGGFSRPSAALRQSGTAGSRGAVGVKPRRVGRPGPPARSSAPCPSMASRLRHVEVHWAGVSCMSRVSAAVPCGDNEGRCASLREGLRSSLREGLRPSLREGLRPTLPPTRCSTMSLASTVAASAADPGVGTATGGRQSLPVACCPRSGAPNEHSLHAGAANRCGSAIGASSQWHVPAHGPRLGPPRPPCRDDFVKQLEAAICSQ
jgi:hypothetical protein